MTSYISVSALEENFGTYTCYVKNAIGNGIPCEIDVTGNEYKIASIRYHNSNKLSKFARVIVITSIFW